MLKKMSMLIAALSLAVVITGCSTLSTTVIPEAQNKYAIVATAQNSATSMNGAIKKATAICTKQDKQLIVLSHKTVYQGAGKQMGSITKMISDTAFMTGGVAGISSTQSATDYKTNIEFQCQ